MKSLKCIPLFLFFPFLTTTFQHNINKSTCLYIKREPPSPTTRTERSQRSTRIKLQEATEVSTCRRGEEAMHAMWK